MRMQLLRRRAPASLFWRVFVANAIVFIAAGLVLALSPATVSSPITLGEATTLVAGIAVMLLINLWLMRRSFAPLSALARIMRRVDPLKPGERVRFQTHDRELSDLVTSFNGMLDRVETERRASAHRELEATDAEQRRIAGELHDEIGQRLTVLLLLLAGAQSDADPTTAARLQEARDLAHEILDDLRGVVVRLRPEALDELGITKALDALARKIEQQTGTPIARRLGELNGDLPPVIGLVVYRVARKR
jgi:two-component system sensor histidine kinase UhpB